MKKTDRENFENLLLEHRIVVERLINYRLPTRHDAEDVIQNTYLSAFRHFADLKNKELFRYWLLSIARNECNLWYRKNLRRAEVPLNAAATISGNMPEISDISDILKNIPPASAKILKLYYFENRSQTEIAKLLNIPTGTAKSRLFYAKKQLKNALPEDIKTIYEKGEIKMDDAMGFPENMPFLKIEKSDNPFFEVRLEDLSFIIPKIGCKCSEATYRYPEKNLTIISTCHVPKKAIIHEVEGVEIRRDTFNVKQNKLHKNESVWFTQLTEEYIRNLGTVRKSEDEMSPTVIYTFLEADYDVINNGNDRIHGLPLVLKKNPATEDTNGIHIDDNVLYTMGVYYITVGTHRFETVKVVHLQNEYFLTERYFDKNNRLVLMRCYEMSESIKSDENSSNEPLEHIKNNTKIAVNGREFIHLEDRISDYTL